jgi:L-aspartate oxidase
MTGISARRQCGPESARVEVGLFDLAWQQRADVVVVGTGVAGLAAALAAHRAGRRVMVLSKADRRPGMTATHYAQGGIAVVLPHNDDSVEAHVADTLAAGGGLCEPEAVYSIVADGYRAVSELVSDGAHFDETASGRWALTREGGHSRRRIVHAGGDATGAEVQRALDGAAAALDVRTNHSAVQVLHDGAAVTGVLALGPDGLGIVHAPAVILATGGLGHLYRATTNPDGSTGDGIALALRAGVAVSDVEFIQFHPTMLYCAGAGRGTGTRRPLITEALRGEGAVLYDSRGESVTAGVHPMGDLAPRDVVAAAIDARLKATGDDHVFLDARSVGAVAARFPTVTTACLAAGIDPARQPIPVVPGAHYSCGGVVTDVFGQTELPGLFAAGEVARTGMHGANRLASNSLLEGLVVGGRAGRAAAAHALTAGRSRARYPDAVGLECAHVALNRVVLQEAMTRYASVVRDADGLRRLTDALSGGTVRRPSRRADLEDAALTLTARAVAAAALAREESRGCHHRADCPDAAAQACSMTVRLSAEGGAVAVDELAAVG